MSIRSMLTLVCGMAFVAAADAAEAVLVQDAHIYFSGSQASRPQGDGAELTLSPNTQVFARFDLAPMEESLGSSPFKATLRIRMTAAQGQGPVEANLVASNWSEADLSAESHPAILDGAVAVSRTFVSANDLPTEVLMDATPLVQAWRRGIPNHGLALSSGGFTASIPSREAAVVGMRLEIVALPASPPVGSVVAWLKSLNGVSSNLSTGWVECNGQAITDPMSPLNGTLAPDLNGSGGGQQQFLRGATASGQSGGSEEHSHIVLDADLSTGGTAPVLGTATDSREHLPPYYEVVWILRTR